MSDIAAIGVEVGLIRLTVVMVGTVVEEGRVGMMDEREVVGVGIRVTDGATDEGAGEGSGVLAGVDGVGTTLETIGVDEGGKGVLEAGGDEAGGSEVGATVAGGGELGGAELGGGDEGATEVSTGGEGVVTVGGAAVVGGGVLGGADMVVGAAEVGGATVEITGALLLIDGGGEVDGVVAGGRLDDGVTAGGAVLAGDDTAEEITEWIKIVRRSARLARKMPGAALTRR